MEGTHRQLRARFTDRLRRNNANSLTDIDTLTACEVAAVALRTHAVANFAGDRRAHHYVIDRVILELCNCAFIKHGARIESHLIRSRNQHCLCEYAPQNTLAQWLNYVTTFYERRHRNTILRFTVDLGNDEILCNVDETPCQVTGVCGLQRGIGKTLASAVRRDEILQYVEAFAEVCGNRRLDN